MSEIDMLKESLTRILRPIIFEAVQEAFAEQRKKPTPKRYYTPAEAQNHLKISRATFYRHVSQGKIEILKIGSKSFVDADKLDKAIERRDIYRYKHDYHKGYRV